MSGNVYRYEAYIWVKDGKDKKKKVTAHDFQSNRI